jgi:hypothetical protein
MGCPGILQKAIAELTEPGWTWQGKQTLILILSKHSYAEISS